MRVLSAENGMYFDDLFLPFQCFEVMYCGDQVLLRCQLVGRMSPVAVGEYTQLATGNEFLQAVLCCFEVTFRVLRPRRELLGEEGCLLRVGFQAGDDIYPVERVQLIEVHRMVVHIKHCFHDVTHHFRIGRDSDIQRMFDRTHRA